MEREKNRTELNRKLPVLAAPETEVKSAHVAEKTWTRSFQRLE